MRTSILHFFIGHFSPLLQQREESVNNNFLTKVSLHHKATYEH